jgi:hypothetical protein
MLFARHDAKTEPRSSGFIESVLRNMQTMSTWVCSKIQKYIILMYHLETQKHLYTTIIGTNGCSFDTAQRQNLDQAYIQIDLNGNTIMQK